MLVARALDLLEGKLTRPREEVTGDVLKFFEDRFANLMASRFPADVVDAVVAAGCDDLVDAGRRIEALTQLKMAADFEPLAVAFKRVVNIIKGGVETAVRPELFEATCEGELAAGIRAAEGEVNRRIDAGDYPAALRAIAALRPAVDRFFDGVMVMAEKAEVRTNRLALLTAAGRLFERIADFSKISA